MSALLSDIGALLRRSRTVWGGLAVFLATIAPWVGDNLPVVRQLVDALPLPTALKAILQPALQLGGTALVFYARYTDHQSGANRA